jgi:hypothetical protein
VNWTLIESPGERPRRHCKRHDETFGIGEVCQSCVADPGDEPGARVTSEAVDADLSKRALEFRSLAKFLHKNGRTLIEDGTALDKGVACKLIAEGTKLERLALEIDDKVSGRDHDRTLIAHEREMAGLRGSH